MSELKSEVTFDFKISDWHFRLFLYKMPKAKSKKKKFIDPKNEPTQTFTVIHRSEKDPLAADSDAPQRILQPLESTKVIFFHQCSDQ